MTDILFLDFDGVLHPLFPRTDRTHEENQHFEGCSRLANVLDRVAPRIKIVVSSTWRYKRSMEELRSLVGPLGGRLIGMTPILNLQEDGTRELEAQQWLDTYTRNHARPIVRWCALDDVPSLWTSREKLLVTGDGFRTMDAIALSNNIEAMLDASETAPSFMERDTKLWLPNSAYQETEVGDIVEFG